MESTADATESNLLSMLKSSDADITNIHEQLFSHLNSFTPYYTSKTAKKSSKTTNPFDATTLDTLSYRYSAFIQNVLHLLTVRFFQSAAVPISGHTSVYLFDIFELCLNSVELLSSMFPSPYVVHRYRVMYMQCLAVQDKCKEAEAEAYSILRSLKDVKGRGFTFLGQKYLPRMYKKSVNVDMDLAKVVGRIVVILLGCVNSMKSENADNYLKVFTLVDEARPWLRGVDAGESKASLTQILYFLSEISFYLVTSKCHPWELKCQFGLKAFEEYKISDIKEMHKFARKLCSYMFPQEDNLKSNIIDMLKPFLNSMVAECKVRAEKAADLLEFVSFIAKECCSRSNRLCNDVIKHLRIFSSQIRGAEFSVVSSFTSPVMDIYAAGLSFATVRSSATGINSNPRINAEGRSASSFFHEKANIFLMLKDSLLSVKHCLNAGGGEGKLCLEALRFACHSLAEFICFDVKVVDEIDTVSPIFDTIHDAFDQFRSIFLRHHSAKVNEKDTADTIARVGVAAVILSSRTKHEVEESWSFLRWLISANWARHEGLECIFSYFLEYANTLYTAKRPEAARVIEVSRIASWKCLAVICKCLVVGGRKRGDDEQIMTAIAICEKVSEISGSFRRFCKTTDDVNRVVKESLESWSAAKTLLEELPVPTTLVRRWVAIQHEYLKDEVLRDRAGNLYNLLHTSKKMSKRLLGFLIDQELKEHEQLLPHNIGNEATEILTEILSSKFDNSKDGPVGKSRILIERGSGIRWIGEKDPKESVRCLSEAISTLNDITDDEFSCEANNLLAYAYCLQGCWALELDNKPKTEPEQQFFRDTYAGLDLCLKPRCSHPAGKCHRMSESLLNMLYHTFDLLSIKGFMDFHVVIYKIIMIYEKLPAEKFLALFWKSRRLGHPLCPSPIDHKIITEFYENHVDLKGPRDWMETIEDSPSIVGFKQSFGSLIVDSPPIEENIKELVEKLISNDLSSDIFMAAYLCYDLCERLVQAGDMIEALSCAKEARRLRLRLFKEQFICSKDKVRPTYDDVTGELIVRGSYKVNTLDVRNPAYTEAWSVGMRCDIEDFVVTPWSVLQCCLESTLQVAKIYEITGNRYEAERLLLWGKSVSRLANVLRFISQQY